MAALRSFVFVLSTSRRSTTTIRSSARRRDSTALSAFFFSPTETSCAYERGTGPWTVPPWRWIGGRPPPCRARPVPFCLKGFLPLPDTSERVLVLCVPARRPARYAFTTSQIRWRRYG